METNGIKINIYPNAVCKYNFYKMSDVGINHPLKFKHWIAGGKELHLSTFFYLNLPNHGAL